MAFRRVARLHALVFVAFLLGIAPPAGAGPYGDALAKCLVEGTTTAEKTTLVRWMFAVMGLHPAVQSSSAVTTEQRTALTKETAELFQRLLTETCATQTREALKYEMQSPIQTSFGVLGQAAVAELFAHPNVQQGLSELAKHFDEKKLQELLAPQKQ